MARNPYDSTRFRFGSDSGGRPLVMRPNEVLVQVDSNDAAVDAVVEQANIAATRPSPDGLDVDQDVISRTQFRPQRRVNDEWLVIASDTVAEVDPVKVAAGLRAAGFTAQPNHVYFVNSLRASPNYLAPNYLAPNYLAPNYLAPNYLAPNYLAPNYLAPNYLAGGGGGAGCACGGCPEAPGQDTPVPEITVRKTWDDQRGPTPTDVADILQIHVLDVRFQHEAVGVKEDVSPQIDARLADYPALTDTTPTTRTEARNQLIGHPGALLPAALYLDEALFRGSNDDSYEKSRDDYLVEPTSPGWGANVNADGYVDPATNHSAFIEGILRRRLNGSDDLVVHHAVAGTLGDVEDADLVKAIDHIRENHSDKTAIRIMNLSLSGYNEDDKPGEALASAVERLQDAGWLVVAAAGNNASCRLAWPAALPEVVSVAAYGPCGPAPFSNFGPWVDACGPGVDVVSDFPGILAAGQGLTLRDGFDASELTQGFAAWSGTSFSAPFVAAMIAARIIKDNTGEGGLDLPKADGTLDLDKIYEAALEKLITHDDALRFPGYGTVVAYETTRVTVEREWNA